MHIKKISCPVCKSETREQFTAQVLKKHCAIFNLCPDCGFLFSTNPHWLSEAYILPISKSDTGIVKRGILNAVKVTSLIGCIFNTNSIYLDYAGGIGLFTRIMRDIGLHFFWEDKYCNCILASGFESSCDVRYEVITAFEVLEHLSDPHAFFKDVLERTDNIILTTTLFANQTPPKENWHYYGFENGQHISFYQLKTLKKLANIYSLHINSFGNLHIFTKKKISYIQFIACSSLISFLIFPFIKLKLNSLTSKDSTELINQNLTL